jgi:hypothetical protein
MHEFEHSFAWQSKTQEKHARSNKRCRLNAHDATKGDDHIVPTTERLDKSQSSSTPYISTDIIHPDFQ